MIKVLAGDAHRNKTESEWLRLGGKERMEWPYLLSYRFRDSVNLWTMYFQHPIDRYAFKLALDERIVVVGEAIWQL